MIDSATTANGLADAFAALVAALGRGDLEGFYGLILPDAFIVDEDLPFRVDRDGFREHIDFHTSGVWEGFAWKPYDVRFAEQGTTGVSAGFAMFRGKPKDGGFRLRPMMFTQGWVRGPQGWRVASWQQSPVVGHVTHQSPG
jgi:ketosteroid isomerase-like protein